MFAPLKNLVFIAACALSICAQAQNDVQSSDDCPAAWEMTTTQLQGVWTADIAGQAHAAELHLAPHPQWQGTVKGTVQRTGSSHAMVGDVDQGNVTLEESANGTNISATWVGTVTDGSCAREIRGQYQEEGENAQPQPFVLHKRTP